MDKRIEKPVAVLLKPVSGLCDMNCTYCFYRDEAHKRETESYGKMSGDTLKNVIRRTMLNAGGYVSYLYQGGEPTLAGLDFFKTATEYQKRYNHNSVHVYNALQTNGYGIAHDRTDSAREWCEFFRREKFLIGLSVDGTKELHDKYRRDALGRGTYDSVVETAKLFGQYGVDYNILTVVTRDLAMEIEKVYEDYRRRGWKYQQYILCLDPLGEAGSGEYSLTPEQYGEFLVRLFGLWYRDYRKGRQPYIREFSNYVGILRGYPAENCAMGGTCTIQNVVESNGNVYPCDFYALDPYCLGNYNQDKFAQIQGHPAAGEFVARSGKLPEECRGCGFFPLCRGGCFRNRVRKAGTEYYQNRFCGSYRRFFRECLGRLKDIAQDKNFKG